MSYRHTYQDEVDCEECCKGLAALLGCIVLLPAFAVGVPIYGACIIVPKVTKKIKKRMLKNRLKVIRALFINKYCSNTSDYSDVQLDKASYGLEGDFRCVYKEKNYSMYITPDWLKLSNVLIIDNIHSRILENDTERRSRPIESISVSVPVPHYSRNIIKRELHEVLEMVQESGIKDQTVLEISDKLKNIYEKN